MGKLLNKKEIIYSYLVNVFQILLKQFNILFLVLANYIEIVFWIILL